MENVTPLVMLGLVLVTLLDLVKYARAKNWNAVFTLGLGWVVGVGVAYLFSETRWADAIVIGDGATLDSLNFAELLVAGLVIVSFASNFVKLVKAFDNTDSAAVPPLMPDKTGE